MLCYQSAFVGVAVKPVGKFAGALYESQLSFYSAVNGLDLTIGHRNPAQFGLELSLPKR